MAQESRRVMNPMMKGAPGFSFRYFLILGSTMNLILTIFLLISVWFFYLVVSKIYRADDQGRKWYG